MKEIEFLLIVKNAKHIKYKQVKVNGIVTSQFNYQLKKGNEIVVGKGSFLKKQIYSYEDNKLIVINKPSGLFVLLVQ